MFKAITIINDLGESLVVDLSDPKKSLGFAIRNISGLGPVKANLSFSKYSGKPGGKFQSANVGQRNIVFDIIQFESPTIEETRLRTYRYFSTGQRNKIIIETDTRFVETEGYVESNEPTIFSNECDSQVSILCPDPYFYSTSDTVVRFSDIIPLFEFPFTDEPDKIQFGEYRQGTIANTEYLGDVETGVFMKIELDGPATNINIYNTTRNEKMRIDTTKVQAIVGSPLQAGDRIDISTYSNNQKSIRLLRNGIFTNIIGALDKNPQWITMGRGKNTFYYNAETGVDNLNFELTFRNAYEGV